MRPVGAQATSPAVTKELKYRRGSGSDNATSLLRCLTDVYAGKITRQGYVIIQRIKSTAEIFGSRQLTIDTVVRRQTCLRHVRTMSEVMSAFRALVKLPLMRLMLMERQRQQQRQICHHQNPWCYNSKLLHRAFLSLSIAPHNANPSTLFQKNRKFECFS